MTLISENTAGVFVISVTPFLPDGAIDWESVDRVTDFYFEKGATGLTILGMMGEAPKLTHKESVEVSRRVIARAAGRPIVVGVSAPGLAALGELSREVMDMGAAGVMVAPPGSLRTDPAIHGYFGQVVRALGDDIPVVLQDFPLATKVEISDQILQKIILDYPSIKMLKHEDWPGLRKISKIRADEAAGQRRISILVGNGGLFLPEEMERGVDGAMTGYAYPEMLAQIVALMQAGKKVKAFDLFDAHLPLIRYETQPGLGLAVRKHTLARRGAIASPALRAPGAGLDAASAAEVDFLIDRLEARLKDMA